MCVYEKVIDSVCVHTHECVSVKHMLYVQACVWCLSVYRVRVLGLDDSVVLHFTVVTVTCSISTGKYCRKQLVQCNIEYNPIDYSNMYVCILRLKIFS